MPDCSPSSLFFSVNLVDHGGFSGLGSVKET